MNAPSPASVRRSITAGLVIAAAALLAYGNSFRVPFVFDDELAIVGNPSLRQISTSLVPPPELSGLPISGRPIVNLSFGISHAMSGDAVWSYHAMNLLIHAACGWLLFGIVRRTLTQAPLAKRYGRAATGLALVIALVWTLHPLDTESVTYISQRAEALLALFYLLALYAFIRGAVPLHRSATEAVPPHDRAPLNGWLVLSAIACLLGALTKEVIVSAPIAVALYARIFLAPNWRETWNRYRTCFGLLATTWLLLGWVVIHEHGARGVSAGFGLGVPWWSYLLKQCEAIVLYLKLAAWPHPLVLDYGTGLVWSLAAVWWQALLLAALAGATVWAVATSRPIGWAGACFFMILAPSSSVVPLVGQTVAEHRMYLPLALVIAVAGLTLYRWLGRTTVALAAAAAVALALTTSARNRDYATPIRICTDTVTKRPDNARAMALLGDYYQRAGRLDDARHWLERSLSLQPGVPAVLSNLGDVWQRLGNPAQAVACFEAALVRRPGDPKLLNNLGNALILSGRPDEGLGRLRAAAAAAPDDLVTRANLANALAQVGRMPEAAEQFADLVRRAPNDVDARDGYAGTLIALRRLPEATEQLNAAVRMRPTDADLHNRLGMVLGRAGRLREALAEFQEALRLNPAHPAARQNAALARQRLGGR